VAPFCTSTFASICACLFLVELQLVFTLHVVARVSLTPGKLGTDEGWLAAAAEEDAFEDGYKLNANSALIPLKDFAFGDDASSAPCQDTPVRYFRVGLCLCLCWSVSVYARARERCVLGFTWRIAV